jgi:hypothetical protein
MAKHIFENYCVDFEPLLSEANFKKMVKAAGKQSTEQEAKVRADFLHYKEYGKKDSCPMYFGLWFEWFSAIFLNHYGQIWNLRDVTMLNEVGSAEEDGGTDGNGFSMIEKKFNQKTRITKAGSPCYLQVKATDNPLKEFKTNDGSRLANFMMNAMSTAIATGAAYHARFIVITSGKGLHYKLDNNSNKMMEVINFDQISKLVDGNVAFLNKLRESVGLVALPLPPAELDAEAAFNIALNIVQ